MGSPRSYLARRVRSVTALGVGDLGPEYTAISGCAEAMCLLATHRAGSAPAPARAAADASAAACLAAQGVLSHDPPLASWRAAASSMVPGQAAAQTVP